MSMSLEEAKKIISKTVAEYGPERAKSILFQRIEHDLDFARVAARHGAEIMKALCEAQNATIH